MTASITPWLSAHHLWVHRRVAATHHASPVPASPQLVAHERVLVRDTSDDGTTCVATDRAVYWRTADPICRWSRAGWSTVEQVGWDRATHVLTLMTSSAPITLRLTGRPRLPGFAAERVAAAHLMSRRVRVSASCAATVAAVRNPDSGGFTWTVRYDPGCDASDPVVTAAMDAALREVRAQAGC